MHSAPLIRTHPPAPAGHGLVAPRQAWQLQHLAARCGLHGMAAAQWGRLPRLPGRCGAMRSAGEQRHLTHQALPLVFARELVEICPAQALRWSLAVMAASIQSLLLRAGVLLPCGAQRRQRIGHALAAGRLSIFLLGRWAASAPAASAPHRGCESKRQTARETRRSCSRPVRPPARRPCPAGSSPTSNKACCASASWAASTGTPARRRARSNR